MVTFLRSENGSAVPTEACETMMDFPHPEDDSPVPTEMEEAVTSYLSEYGIGNRDVFADRVRTFFDESQRHYDRVALRNAVAKSWKLNMNKRSGRDKLCRRVATERGLDRKVRLQWESGEVDARLDEIKLCLYKIPDAGCKLPSFNDPIPPVRMGIARTLTYVRVLPPKVLLHLPEHVDMRAKSLDVLRHLPEAGAIPEDEIVKCWKLLKDHEHFKSHKGELNQHALDEVRDRFRKSQFWNSLWIEPERVGDLKSEIETEAYPRLWLWPWIVFKYSTLANIQSTNRPARNPHRWIWNARHPRHAELWRRSNEM